MSRKKSEFDKSVAILQERHNAIIDDIREKKLDAPGVADAISDLCGDIQSLGEEQREKKENMPESLQMGPTGELLEERADMCDETAEAFEDAARSIEEIVDGVGNQNWPEEAASILAEVNWSM